MALIVALFLGLTISAEEIFRDRKILKRERFLNLSRSSYLVSKIVILVYHIGHSVISFCSCGKPYDGYNHMGLFYWLPYFPQPHLQICLGLNISASFNSAVTIYILIPLIMIP